MAALKVFIVSNREGLIRIDDPVDEFLLEDTLVESLTSILTKPCSFGSLGLSCGTVAMDWCAISDSFACLGLLPVGSTMPL